MQREISTPLELRNAAAGEEMIDLTRRPRPLDTLIRGFLFICAAISVVTTVGIVLVLIFDAIKFFQRPEPTLTEFVHGDARGSLRFPSSASFPCSMRPSSPA